MQVNQPTRAQTDFERIENLIETLKTAKTRAERRRLMIDYASSQVQVWDGVSRHLPRNI